MARHRGPSKRPLWRLAALVLVLVVELAALVLIVDRDDPASSATLNDVYATPDPFDLADPGTPVRVWELSTPLIDGTVYGVLYHSESVPGADIAVSGYIVVPPGPAPAGGRPMVTLGHGTVGSGDICAPSRSPAADADTVNPFLAAGWVVVASDLEGIGGTGRHPYLVGTSEARSMIDAVRATRTLLGAGVSDRFVAWGISQGGHGALFAREQVAAWAPELEMVGTVAVAPVSDVAGFVDLPTIAPHGVVMLAASGALAAYSDIYPSDLLTGEGQADLAAVDQHCLSDLNSVLSDTPLDRLVRAAPTDIPRWAEILAENTPGEAADVGLAVPVLLVQGDGDPIIPLATTRSLFERLCDGGATAEIQVIEGGSHADVVDTGRSGYLSWMSDRFAGLPAPQGC